MGGFQTPPPLPQPPPAPQPSQGTRGFGPQGPPQGLSADPAVANHAANIAKGLSMFLQSYTGAKQQTQQMFGQKVDAILDDLASGRRDLSSVNQKEVAKWMKLSGRAYNTQEYTPEAAAWNQQSKQTQQLADQVQQRMQQQQQTPTGPPVQPGGAGQMNPILQSMLLQGMQQRAPTPTQTGQPQLQPMTGPPAQMTQPQPGGIGGLLQRLLNPAAGASANSPAGDMVRDLAMAGSSGPNSPESIRQRNVVSQLAMTGEGQKVMAQMGGNNLLIGALSKYHDAYLDSQDPKHFEAITALQRAGMAQPSSEDQLLPFMHIIQAQANTTGKQLDPGELFSRAFEMDLNYKLLGQMRGEAIKHAYDTEQLFTGGDPNQSPLAKSTHYWLSGGDGEPPAMDPTKALDYTKAIDQVNQMVPIGIPAGTRVWLTNMLTSGSPGLVKIATDSMNLLKPGTELDYQLKSFQAKTGRMGAEASQTEAAASMDRASTMVYEAVDKSVQSRIELLKSQFDESIKDSKPVEAQLLRKTIAQQANAAAQSMTLRGQKAPLVGLGESGRVGPTAQIRSPLSHIEAAGAEAPLPPHQAQPGWLQEVFHWLDEKNTQIVNPGESPKLGPTDVPSWVKYP